MNNPDAFVNTMGVLYGVFLVVAAFVSNRLTESMRIDAMFMKQYSEKTRPLNLVAGSIIACYGIYSLLGG